MIGIEFGAVFEISQLNYECHHLLLALLLKLVARTYRPASAIAARQPNLAPAAFLESSGGHFEQQLELSMPMPIETKEV
jgi:hypothetical protein